MEFQRDLLVQILQYSHGISKRSTGTNTSIQPWNIKEIYWYRYFNTAMEYQRDLLVQILQYSPRISKKSQTLKYGHGISKRFMTNVVVTFTLFIHYCTFLSAASV